MRALVTLLAAGTLISGCACTEMDLIGLPVENDQPAFVDSTTTTSVTDGRIPGGWFLYPDDVDPTAMCGGASGALLPCRDVLAVCVEATDGRLEPKWLGEAIRCTDESPTWRDVCRTRPDAEWAFYGYTREECAAA